MRRLLLRVLAAALAVGSVAVTPPLAGALGARAAPGPAAISILVSEGIGAADATGGPPPLVAREAVAVGQAGIIMGALGGTERVLVIDGDILTPPVGGLESVLILEGDIVLPALGGSERVLVIDGDILTPPIGGLESVLVLDGDLILPALGGTEHVLVMDRNAVLPPLGGVELVRIRDGTFVLQAVGGSERIVVGDVAALLSAFGREGVTIRDLNAVLSLTVTVPRAVEATGPGGAPVIFTATARDSVDSTVTPTCVPASGSTFPLGLTTIICTAVDSAGGRVSASAGVTVVDTTPPVLTVPADIATEATSIQGAVVTYTASAVDIVDGSVRPVCVPASGSTFPVGVTRVTCTATDAHGNAASRAFNVTVTRMPTATVLTANPNPAFLDQKVTLAAAVTTQGTGVATGSVDFLDAGKVIGTAVLDGTGTASFSTTALALGHHALTASYRGDAAHLPSVSAAVVEVVRDSRIAFSTDRDGNLELYSMNADGSGATRLTNHPALDSEPAWSPDGTRLAFVSTRSGSAQIWVLKLADGSVTRLVTDAAIDLDTAWSPDGALIAYVSTASGTPQVWIVGATGVPAPHRLTNDRFIDTHPTWSPDGRQIAYSSTASGLPQIWMIAADGSVAPRRITNEPAADAMPAWSPDGRSIAYTSVSFLGTEIYAVSPAGGTPRRVTNNPGAFDSMPAWSPDSTHLAFVSTRDGNLEIYSVGADGTGQTRLTSNHVVDITPSWCCLTAP